MTQERVYSLLDIPLVGVCANCEESIIMRMPLPLGGWRHRYSDTYTCPKLGAPYQARPK